MKTVCAESFFQKCHFEGQQRNGSVAGRKHNLISLNKNISKPGGGY